MYVEFSFVYSQEINPMNIFTLITLTNLSNQDISFWLIFQKDVSKT